VHRLFAAPSLEGATKFALFKNGHKARRRGHFAAAPLQHLSHLHAAKRSFRSLNRTEPDR